MTIKAGQTAHWDVAIGGEPPPEVNWFKGDIPLAKNDLIQVVFDYPQKFINKIIIFLKKREKYFFVNCFKLIQIEIIKNERTILSVQSATRADCGKYKLMVKNSTGKDEEAADLTVLDKPGKPRGPLQV